MTHIYLVVLNDEPVEILSAWTSQERADTEIQRQLAQHQGPSFHWLQVRLEVQQLPLEISKDAS